MNTVTININMAGPREDIVRLVQKYHLNIQHIFKKDDPNYTEHETLEDFRSPKSPVVKNAALFDKYDVRLTGTAINVRLLYYDPAISSDEEFDQWFARSSVITTVDELSILLNRARTFAYEQYEKTIRVPTTLEEAKEKAKWDNVFGYLLLAQEEL